MRDTYIASLNDIDEKYPKPNICNILSKQENTDLLEYVVKDPFGCHIFPGDIDNYPLTSFYNDMNKEIKKAENIHLWVYIPTCRYRCHFCQFPTVIVNPNTAKADSLFKEIVDLNIKEATFWLKQVPNLTNVSIGEFNIFGGTPSLLPDRELKRLINFYKNNFNFSSTTMRFEGEPGSLNKEYLSLLKELGFSKLSFGTQSFQDHLIKACGRKHTAEESFKTIADANTLGFELISVDLIYGLFGQTVDDVKNDMEIIKKLNISHVVCTKLHMKEFMETRTGVSGERDSLWQKKIISDADKLIPSLGKQYQMRDLIDKYLAREYNEHPTMYFYKKNTYPEKWKSLITDLNKQYPEIAIGLGGSSKSISSEMINITNYKQYKESIIKSQLPCHSIRGFSNDQKRINAFKMALSSLIPVDDNVYKAKFDGESFFTNKTINHALTKLQLRKLIFIDNNRVFLTKEAAILIESIINTQFC
ncbi:MAG TPA: radical SAM protein [Arsenophonus nasoniae]|uniref:radical SAM protein n=1 Tax=Arsenophonus nasoniae TaxID=638 RepID=UPI0038792167